MEHIKEKADNDEVIFLKKYISVEKAYMKEPGPNPKRGS